MPKRVEVKVIVEAHAGRCPFCGADYVLTHSVVFWGLFPVPACRVCSRTIGRLVSWEGEARRRYHQKRTETREAEATPTS